MSSFDEIAGVAGSRPGKAARDEAAKNCLASAPDGNSKRQVKSLLIILHGVKSKESLGASQVKRVRDLAAERGIALTEVVTQRSGHCEELVAEAGLSTVDAVGVMGGDGTLREGVCGMLRRAEGDRRPIFVFPVGTGNNFARDLGVRTIEDMFAVIDRGTIHPVDAVKVTHAEGSTYSINCVTWGMARDAADTAEGLRWMGPLRYDFAGLYHIILNKLNYAKIGVLPGGASNAQLAETEEYDDYLMIFAQNTRCSGRGFAFTPVAKLDDGLFDFICVKKSNVLRNVMLFEKVKAGGGHVEDPVVYHQQLREMTLKIKDTGDMVGIDGEVNVRSPIKLEACKGVFETLV